MLSNEKSTDALDLSHHLSKVGKARHTSPLKGLQKYMGKPGLISLAGGLPNAAYFPFSSVSGEILAPDSFPLKTDFEESSLSWFWKLFSRSDKERTSTFTVGKYSKRPGDLDLENGLQYGLATGQPKLNEVIREFVGKVFQPAYKNWTTLVHTGNTDAWFKTVQTILNPGEGLIVSEWTYPSAMASAQPFGIIPVPVGMDSEGMSSISLRETLSEWDESARGMPRPHVMYTVPVGQNPTGTTMGIQRKKEIYDICVEYDIIIVEDDPYYFLQQGKYVPKSDRVAEPDTDDEFTLEPAMFGTYSILTILRLDYQGRVIRLDTFSKTVCPGSRLGWFTCNPMFAERLERTAETSSQAPSGFTQIYVASLLLKWHYEGYIRWLKALRLQYKQRRDYFLDCFADEFHLKATLSTEGYTAGAHIYHASLKPKRSFVLLSEKDVAYSKPLFSFVPPSSGMFLWLELHLDDHPSFSSLGYKALEMKLWTEIADAGVLFAPGAMFFATPVEDDTPGYGHFRISFSNSTVSSIL
ncbi:pyridoxal phosphate-dependent transferase [Lentinula edodes]|uniref:pyridoxal phosphate-dependent transferase n=1 Tax=Lentinula edodes TaxID=5353 RepID=UPI001E8CF6BA|nr:pyridoxal phosphate-dependent transferase [Lentinula edodes]KAH7879766.1 pyridoxal phosphate-dependent transferase [Lentinula edodes]